MEVCCGQVVENSCPCFPEYDLQEMDCGVPSAVSMGRGSWNTACGCMDK